MRAFTLSIITVLSLTTPAFAQREAVETTGSVRVRVILPDGPPAKEAHVHASVWTTDKSFKSNQNYSTDADGWVTVHLPKTVQILRLWARKRDHVPLFMNWSIRELRQQGKDASVPKQFQFKLPAGTRMSGMVKNEDGNPIDGVDVEVRYTGGPNMAVGTIRPGTWLAEGKGKPDQHPALKTDKNGRWALNNVPAGDNTPVLVKLRHRDYVNDKSWGSLQRDQAIAMSDFRDGSAVIVMKRGIRLRGLVVDAATSKPIRGAVVAFGDDPYFQTDSQEVRTNENGFYEFPPMPVGKLRVTVMAPGYAPEMKEPEISEELAKRKLRFDASFRMKPGHTVRIKFTENGNPLACVYVGIRGWRTVKSLYNHKHPNVLDTKIPHRANDEGLWEWTWAPEGPVKYSFGLVGYEVIPADATAPLGEPGNRTLRPRAEPYEVKLRKKARRQ